MRVQARFATQLGARARALALLQLVLLAHAALAGLHHRHSHRRLHDVLPARWGRGGAAERRGTLDVPLPQVHPAAGSDAAAQPGGSQRRLAGSEAQALHGETPEHAARAEAMMEALLQDILDAEGAVVAHRDLRCSCQYGSGPGAWLPAAGEPGEAWSPLDGDCQVGDLLSGEALRRRSDDSAGVLQVGGERRAGGGILPLPAPSTWLPSAAGQAFWLCPCWPP
jgi:hypothetical protein